MVTVQNHYSQNLVIFLTLNFNKIIPLAVVNYNHQISATQKTRTWVYQDKKKKNTGVIRFCKKNSFFFTE